MAILKIKKYGENVLRQKSKEVTKISKKIQVLIENLVDTMYHNNGVGLAAPQVGENVRIFVIDVTEPNQAPDPIIFINPKIIKKEGMPFYYNFLLFRNLQGISQQLPEHCF